MPFALSITSPVKNYDSGGVSIEGSKPRDGHLGAIVYGACGDERHARWKTAARSSRRSRAIDPRLRDRRVQHRRSAASANDDPTLRGGVSRAARPVECGRALRVADGVERLERHARAKPDYVTFTAWRNTPLEEAARDFMLARSGLPRGSRLWTFGTPSHADDDGWPVEAGSLHALRGALELTAGAGNRIVLVSPREVALAGDAIDGIVIGLADEVEVATIDVDARTAIDAPWRPLARANAGALQTSPAGRIVKRMASAPAGEVDQIRVTLSLVARAQTTLTRVAILVNG